jgi:ATP-binding cassette subfamily B protein
LELHVFHVQQPAVDHVSDLIDEKAAADRRVNFARDLVGPVYTAMAYSALVAALALVSVSDATSLTSLGAVMLVMLRSLSYGQSLQTSLTTVIAAVPFTDALATELARFDAAKAPDRGAPIDHVGELRLDHVTFSYVPGHPVLRDLTVAIPSREVVGIIGPSGGGKSTLVQLLLGLRTPDSGAITADGRPISTLDREEWARRVTFVPQSAHLFTGTVADNIRFMRAGVTDEDVVRAADLAHLTPDIDGFPERFERRLGEGGATLSGGQQQRLCIARALVEDPDVLILDEPTSALDVRSEHLVRSTLLDLRSRMTVIIIAHRLSTLDICDRIMVVQDGELKGFDSPTRLAETSSFYHEALVLSGLR